MPCRDFLKKQNWNGACLSGTTGGGSITGFAANAAMSANSLSV